MIFGTGISSRTTNRLLVGLMVSVPIIMGVVIWSSPDLLNMFWREAQSRYAVRHLPGCWQTPGQGDVVIYRIGRGSNIMVLGQLDGEYSDWEMYFRTLDRERPLPHALNFQTHRSPWVIETDTGHDMTIEPLDDGRILVSASDLIADGIWSSCPGQDEYTWVLS